MMSEILISKITEGKAPLKGVNQLPVLVSTATLLQ